MIVVACEGSPVPSALSHCEHMSTDAVPTRAQLQALSAAIAAPSPTHAPAGRLAICGTDAAFAAVVTRLMRTSQLATELAFISPTPTPVTTHFHLPLGDVSAALAGTGTAHQAPILRDDTGTAILGGARWLGPDGTGLEGQVYADSEHVFSGAVSFVEIAPTAAAPGLRVATSTRHGLLRRRRWYTARATQYGGPGVIVVRDGVAAPRPVRRSSIYRHTEPMHLVMP